MIEELCDIITKDLYVDNYFLEEISEKIRLFYVALTRAREKMYFIIPDLDSCKLKSSYYHFLNHYAYPAMLNVIMALYPSYLKQDTSSGRSRSI